MCSFPSDARPARDSGRSAPAALANTSYSLFVSVSQTLMRKTALIMLLSMLASVFWLQAFLYSYTKESGKTKEYRIVLAHLLEQQEELAGGWRSSEPRTASSSICAGKNFARKIQPRKSHLTKLAQRDDVANPLPVLLNNLKAKTMTALLQQQRTSIL